MKLYTECMNKEEKLKKVKDLYKQVNDYFIKEYLDLESMENLDMKIEVLDALLAGKSRMKSSTMTMFSTNIRKRKNLFREIFRICWIDCRKRKGKSV